MAFLLNNERVGSRLGRVLRRVGLRVGLVRHYDDFLDSVVVMSAFLDDYGSRRSTVRLGISWLSHYNFLYARMMMMAAFFYHDSSSRLSIAVRLRRISLGWVARLHRIGLRSIARLDIRLRRVLLGRVWLRSPSHRKVDMQFPSRPASIVQRNPLLEEASLLEHVEVEVSLRHELIRSATVPVVHQKANALLVVPNQGDHICPVRMSAAVPVGGCSCTLSAQPHHYIRVHLEDRGVVSELRGSGLHDDLLAIHRHY